MKRTAGVPPRFADYKIDHYHKVAKYYEEQKEQDNMAKTTGQNIDHKPAKATTGNQLLRPEDIPDAVDGRDLLATLVSQNIDKVGEKIDLRKRQAWLEKETKLVKSRY